MDPMWIKAGSDVLGAALGGSKAGGPSMATSGGYFDGSNWTVTTGGAAAVAQGGAMPVLLAAVAVVAVVWLKGRK